MRTLHCFLLFFSILLSSTNVSLFRLVRLDYCKFSKFPSQCGHTRLLTNEIADFLAKSGASLTRLLYVYSSCSMLKPADSVCKTFGDPTLCIRIKFKSSSFYSLTDKIYSTLLYLCELFRFRYYHRTLLLLYCLSYIKINHKKTFSSL